MDFQAYPQEERYCTNTKGSLRYIHSILTLGIGRQDRLSQSSCQGVDIVSASSRRWCSTSCLAFALHLEQQHSTQSAFYSHHEASERAAIEME